MCVLHYISYLLLHTIINSLEQKNVENPNFFGNELLGAGSQNIL